MQSSSIVLKREVLPLDDRMQNFLKLNDNDQVLYIQRLRLADGIPLMLSLIHIWT